MPTLVIIESPGKRKKLESILGDGYVVRASFGHVRDLPEHDLGVDLDSYQPRYIPKDKAKDVLGKLRVEASHADAVLLATDPDREGEAIAWHLAESLRLKDPRRITFTEISAPCVLSALQRPRAIDMSLVQAQEARRVLDRLVGFQVSPVLSEQASRTLSAGRVQTPAVRLVVERDRAIAAFTPVDHFGVALTFAEPEPWTATWKSEGQILDRAVAARIAQIRRLQVAGFKESETRVAPPPPFITTTLAASAQAKLKFKPKNTMELAQRLYEQGAITYMRVDSPNLSDAAFAAISSYAKDHNLPVVTTKRTWKAKQGAQEAHEAIRPTHIDARDAGETPEESALYRLIWERAVASQLADAVYSVRTVDLADDGILFVGRGRKLIDAGWKQLVDQDAESDPEDADAAALSNPVPKLLPNAVVTAVDGKVTSKTTKAPKRFTLATLVMELESHGIGRPSTYSAILDNVMRREYIAEDKKGFLSATPLGNTVVDHLTGVFRFLDLDYTRTLEQDLDEIAAGEKEYRAVVAAVHADLAAEIARVPKSEPAACPACASPLRRRTGAKGPFWGCSGYPKCKVTVPDVDGQPGQPKPKVEAIACPRCAKALLRRTRSKADDPKGRGFDFWACSGYPKCTATFKVADDGSPILC